jgi:diamine N-acetyltransferase
MFLENNILKLRAPEPEDLENLYRWENMSEHWVSCNTRQPYSRYALKKYISNVPTEVYSSGQLRLMIVDKNSGNTVGTVDLFDFEPHHSRMALGLFVAPEFQGRGIAGSTLSIIEKYVFEFLKINQLYCEIAIDNPASLHIFRKAGYHENILKSWIMTPGGFQDIVVFQMLRDDYLTADQAI